MPSFFLRARDASGFAIAITLLFGACGSDSSPAPTEQTESPSTADGGNGGPPTDDTDTPPTDSPNEPTTPCATGTFQSCQCQDGASGSRVCLDGSFGACFPCPNDPCTEGTENACACEGGIPGSQECIDGKYGDCECAAPTEQDGGVVGPGQGACPASLECVDIAGQGGMFGVCASPASPPFPAIPPTCTTVADCTAKGLTGASCASYGGLPLTFCIQACKL